MSIIDPNLLADLFASRNVELVKWEDNSLQVLAVLHPVDEVSTHDVALRKYKVKMDILYYNFFPI